MVTARRSLVLPALGAGVLVLIAFLTSSGDLSGPPTQQPTAWVDAALILAGGAAIAGLVVAGGGQGLSRRRSRNQRSGWLSLGLFSAVAGLSALSIAWSVAPDQSWEEAGRTVALLGVFVVGLALARRSPRSSAATLGGLTLATVALCVWALAVKVLGLDLYGQPSYGRLLATFSYWNATGLTGALALPGLLFFSSRPGGSALARGAAVAAITLCASVVVLSLSRSALFAALVGTVGPLLVMRARRRAILMLALGLAGGVPVWLDALGTRTLAHDASGSIYGATGHLHRSGAELMLGLIILAVGLLLTAVGTALSRHLDRHRQPAGRRRVFDRLLLTGVLAVPVAVVLWLLLNARGPTGEISHLWTQLTSVKGARVGDQAARLGSVANSRSAYWRQALSVGEHHLLLGTGTGTFFPAHLRYSTASLTPAGEDVKHAHSYLLDAFAGLGLVGVGLTLALFLAWCRDASGSVRLPRSAGEGSTAAVTGSVASGAVVPDVDARWALVGLVATFGVSSALDWTWSFPGVAVPALFAAGWISGVGRPIRTDPPTPRATAATATATATAATAATSGPLPLSRRPGTILALTLIATLTLVVAWESLQPMRSVQSADASVLAQITAAGDRGRADAAAAYRAEAVALSDARAAVAEDPFSVQAQARLAVVLGALGDPAGEEAELVHATRTQPENPQPFTTLGSLLLCRGRFGAALSPLHRAVTLDVTNSSGQLQMLAAAQSRRRLCAGATP